MPIPGIIPGIIPGMPIGADAGAPGMGGMPYIICCCGGIIIMGCCIIICAGDTGAVNPELSGCADRTVWAAPAAPGALPNASKPLNVPGPDADELAVAFFASLFDEMPPRSTRPAKSPNVLLVLATAAAAADVGADDVKSPKSLSTGAGAC